MNCKGAMVGVDLLVPNQVLYQAEPLPDTAVRAPWTVKILLRPTDCA